MDSFCYFVTMNINLEMPCREIILYHVEDPEEKILNIKRFLRQKYNSDLDSTRLTRLVKTRVDLENDDKIFDVLKNDDFVTVLMRLCGGPATQKNQRLTIHVDLEGYSEKSIRLELLCCPSDTIATIQYYVLELLFDMKKHNLSHSDVELIYKDIVLHPSKLLAEYKSLSRSFITFNQQESIFNKNKTKGFLIDQFSEYYHEIYIGNRTDHDPDLTLSRKIKNSDQLKSEYSCLCICQNETFKANLMPCCRKYCCKDCFDNIIKTKICPICFENYQKKK